MDSSTLVAFWAVSFLFVITPGADWAYAIAAGLRHESVWPAVGGLLTGHLAATVAVAAGVAALIARTPNVLTVLTVAGSAYLIWLGMGTLTHPSTPEATTTSQGSTARQVATGFGVSGLNPKVFLLFLARAMSRSAHGRPDPRCGPARAHRGELRPAGADAAPGRAAHRGPAW